MILYKGLLAYVFLLTAILLFSGKISIYLHRSESQSRKIEDLFIVIVVLCDF